MRSLDAAKPGLVLELAESLLPSEAVAPSRAHEVVPPSAPKARPLAKTSAGAVLSAVNAVLRDIPEDKLRSMPAEDLARLSGLILDQLSAGTESRAPVEALSILAKARMEKLEPLWGKPISEVQRNPCAGGRFPDVRDVRGVPSGSRVLPPAEASQVFRHYTSPAGLRSILSSGRLRNGPLAYLLNVMGNVWRYFGDMTGVFLTLPEVEGGAVGVAKSRAYVDVKVPAGLPVIEVEPGRIYLIPLPVRTKDDLMSRFLRWIKGSVVKPVEAEESRALDAEGGPGPALSVPVEIVGSGG
jgi:hypothetical protein